jgi:pyrrolysine biosynthesis protein PylC
MILCIVGGKLQGIEAAYLARKAGYRTILVDKKPDPPAKLLVDEFYNMDVNEEEFLRIAKNCDAILPANENYRTLKHLEKICNKIGVIFLQDNSSFLISSNKLSSIALFKKIGVLYPETYTIGDTIRESNNIKYPVILKPVSKSGGEGVRIIKNASELEELLEELQRNNLENEFFFQKYINGPLLSIEVISTTKKITPLFITSFEVDEAFSCKRVIFPAILPYKDREYLINSAVKLARGLKLRGLMDVQAIYGIGGESCGNIYTMEINARLPSQTPTVVYNATGVNMLEILWKVFSGQNVPKFRSDTYSNKKVVIYQHIWIKDRVIYIIGERAVSTSKNLSIEKNFFGSEAITNLTFPEDKCFKQEGVATLIVKSNSYSKAYSKLYETLNCILREYKAKKIVESNVNLKF